MSQRIVVDPVTRIEGHLRIDCEVDGGRVKKAWSSGQMWRGIEVILQGRDPREAWLFTQRFCGVCTTVHAIASVRAVENAVGIQVPLNAQYIRNIILAAHAMHDHIVHFYHLSALDWVDVVSALQADPAATANLAQSLSDWPMNSVKEMTAVKARLAGFVEAGQLGPFANGYWGHPAMKLPPEVNLLAVSHYLQALDYQRKANQVVTILGSKTPNIQNLAVGGVANAINLDNESTLNMTKLYTIKSLLDEMVAFIQQVYLPDVCAIGALYADWLGYGSGVTNYLAVPDLPLDSAGTKFDLPGGTIMNGDLATAKPITSFTDPYFSENVTESIAHAWYDGDWTRHPYEEDTVPKYTGFEDDGAYSWIKAPRFGDKPMQVGPLAQVLVGAATGHEPTQRWLNFALDTAGAVAKTKLTPAMLHSTLGRHLARAVRTAVICEMAQKHWQLLVENIASGDTAIFEPPVFQGEQVGFGFHEAPRGTLSHFVVIRDGKIANYQAVVPSTWNAGPRDEQNRPGPYEASLVGNPIADPERPLEVLRTIHSFDPCIACAVHTLDVEGNEIARVKAL
ncbi:MAG: nickel-dependent hydrogenase large subunit [Candidatus Eisenbacteria bacterium]|uniref:Nickel-dependent hydrogenase large subunit n=1 Tax=Eiseniibacteriota bacterium TaxID=2212470 RepID=A0A956NF98_UNCEI|nr:nickel-dependent hydrogenase large subunit [Candidatus Eisenbacteria bacterium]MCB9465310.1 nickel-dependent hydrogenase large subunit [Candidatus Eisenbacteria bacterium]